jgi:gluconolactonase
MLFKLPSTLAFTTVAIQAAAASNAIVSIPPELAYLLPPQYSGELQEAFVNTNTTNKADNNLLAAAQAAPFVSYDPEFLDIIGKTPTLKLLAERKLAFAGEAGVWDPDRNEVWFTSNSQDSSPGLEVLNLQTGKLRVPTTTLPILDPNGGYYFNGTIYITSGGSLADAPCIYAINPATGATSIVLNTYFGLAFNGPNDVTWVKRDNKAYMFFTDDPISVRYSPGSKYPAQLPDAVWRFDPQERSLVPVISRADILIPNGIRVNANMTTLYVTDTSATDAFPALAGGAGGIGSPAIYAFDLDEEMFPVNKRLVGITRTGVSDGIHIDDYGRIWTAEYEGVVVRSALGKVLGVFNSQAYSTNAATIVANFALAGDQLIILDVERLWSVKLAQTLVSPERYQL